MKKHIVYMMSTLLFLLLVLSGCSTTQRVEDIKKVEVEKEPIVVTKSDEVIVISETIDEDKKVVITKKSKEEQFVLHLISTAHNKGNLFPYDIITDTQKDYSVMNVLTYVNSLKASGEDVILLNSGNNFSFTPLLYYFNEIETLSDHILPALYNKLEYDAVSVGLGDIEEDERIYTKVFHESNFPYIGANIVDEETQSVLVDPYVIVKKGDISIAVVGLTDPTGASWLLEGIAFNDMVETAIELIPQIREKEDVDFIVALVSSEDEDFATKAKEVISLYSGGFDLIVGAPNTTATIAKDKDGKEVYIIGSQSEAESVNHLEVTFTKDDGLKTFQPTSIRAKDVLMKDVEIDKDLLELFDERVEKATSWAQTRVTKVSDTLSSRDALFKDSPFTDTIHALQRAITSSEISVAAPHFIDSTIEKGEVRIADLFKLYGKKDYIYTINLTGEEILKMATHSYNGWFNTMSSLEDDLIKFKKDDNGEFVYNSKSNFIETYNDVSEFDSYSQINYVVNITRPESVQVVMKTLEDGRAFSPKRTYTVSIPSSRAKGKGGHLEAAGLTKELLKSRIVDVSEKDIMFYLLRESKNYRTIELSYDNNWLVIPALWANKGMENSYYKLFGEEVQ